MVGLFRARRMQSDEITLHQPNYNCFAGFWKVENFYAKISSLNYDIIGLSYYPLWHGKDLNALKTTVSKLVTTFNKSIFIAETAYPFAGL